MSNEARVHSSLQIVQGNINYSSAPTSFTADVTGTKGPTPGAISVPLAGCEVDLSELTTAGFCRFLNLDETNYVQRGIWVGATFYEVDEIGPGESYVVKLSRTIQTAGTPGNALGLMSVGGVCDVVVEAFEA